MWTQLCLLMSVSCTVWLGTWAMSSRHICNVRSVVHVTGGVLHAITLGVINWCSILAKLGTAQDWCRDWHSTCLLHHQQPPTLVEHTCTTDQPNETDAWWFLEQDVLSCVFYLLSEYCISLLKLPIRATGCPWKPFFTLAMQSVATLSHQICFQCLFTWNETVNLSGDVLNYS